MTTRHRGRKPYIVARRRLRGSSLSREPHFCQRTAGLLLWRKIFLRCLNIGRGAINRASTSQHEYCILYLIKRKGAKFCASTFVFCWGGGLPHHTYHF